MSSEAVIITKGNLVIIFFKKCFLENSNGGIKEYMMYIQLWEDKDKNKKLEGGKSKRQAGQ